MSEFRLRCRTEGCENTIQPATAKRNDGYCGPCHGKLAKAKREAYIRANRRDVDLYAGLADAVDILCVAHEDKPYDPLINYLAAPRRIEELYASLSLPQANRLMAIATESLRVGKSDFAETVACHLGAFTDFNLDSMLLDWIKLNRFSPAIAFRSAGAEVGRQLLSKLQSDDINANHALQAAAWIGSDMVMEAYQEFDKRPRAWAGQLHVRPSYYARTAGWEISKGERRELSVNRCFSIVPVQHAGADSGVRLFVERKDRCPWCDYPLINLLEVEGDHPFLKALGLIGNRLEVTTCVGCAMSGTLFCELNTDGRGRLSPSNMRPRHILHELCPIPWQNHPIELVERRATHAADEFLATEYSQLGGLPAWVQDIEYPDCFKCRNAMIFIAQVDLGQFPRHEGMYYAFLCRECRTTSTGYQQT
jgi:hypothetical protein